ncbi:hypothetical protein FQA39_LY16448 [Lamprigera yunnana]|nr:hypothetical protein FQA39_LY16448 [Lamprigera yunnana]
MITGEEIVITGIAGSLPKSKNVLEYFKNLCEKNDLFTDIDPYWQTLYPRTPLKIGKIITENKFDSGYFGLHHHQTEAMFRGCRRILEVAVEAILDSGNNPNDLFGSNTGVFVGHNHFQNPTKWYSDENFKQRFGVTGGMVSTYAHQLSYHLGLQGPSSTIDSACNSSLYALEHAVRAMRLDKCDSAIVGGINFLEDPYIQTNIFRLGVLDPIGENKIFDEGEVGYVRSEAVVVIYLQKLKKANRIYSEILNILTNCDGYKAESITYPSREDIAENLRDSYNQINIDPAVVAYVECHATGTKACSVEELNAIEKVFLPNRKTPLMIGTVKTNIGHCEGVSGLCSLIKVLLALENGCMPPHRSCTNLRKDIAVLHSGKVIIPTDLIPLPNENLIVGINNSGFGGTNCHLIIKYHPESTFSPGKKHTKRLICASGRTLESLNNILEGIKPKHEGYAALIQNIFRSNIVGYPYRGFAVVDNDNVVEKSAKYCQQKESLYLIFTGYGKNWLNVYKDISDIPMIMQGLAKVQNLLLSQGVDFFKILNNRESVSFSECLLASVALQICIGDFLKHIIQKPIQSYGVSSGIAAHLYFNQNVTFEELFLIIQQLCCRLEKNTKIGASPSKVKNFKHNTEEKELLKEFFFVLNQSDSKLCDSVNKNGIQDLTENQSKLMMFNKIPFESLALTVGPEIVVEQSHRLLQLSSNESTILNILGKLYEFGLNLDLEIMYPTESWPVKAPPISPLITWNHDEKWYVCEYKPRSPYKKVYSITLEDDEWSFLSGHKINGYNLFPAAAYLYLVWNFYLEARHLVADNVKIIMEDVKFFNLVLLSKRETLKLTVEITKITKRFEIREGDDYLVSGRIRTSTNGDDLIGTFSFPDMQRDEFMTAKDVYKKLRLQGYHYKDAFCGLEEVNLDVTSGKCRWQNWITFTDQIGHLLMARDKSMGLYLPTKIDRLIFDQNQQKNYVKRNSLFPLYLHEFGNLVVTPGIQIENISYTSIQKRLTKKPTLEVYKFVSFYAKLTKEESIVVHIQLVLENLQNKVNIIEIIDEYSNEDDIMCVTLKTALQSQIAVNYSMRIYSSKNLRSTNVTIENKSINEISSDTTLVVLSRASKRSKIIAELFDKVPNTFILSREDTQYDVFDKTYVVSVHHTNRESFILLRKPAHINTKMITINNNSFEWLQEVHQAVSKNERILFVAQNEPTSGILGFVNCLKYEFNNIACVFLMDDGEIFNIDDNFYKIQIQKNLLMNVLKGGQWGSYRHLPLTERLISCKHGYAMIDEVNISNVEWVQGSISSNEDEFNEDTLIEVFYADINFNTSVAFKSFNLEMHEKFGNLGKFDFGFSGTNSSGKRFMSVSTNSVLTNLISEKTHCLCEIPDEWTMEEAATVPVPYFTVLYALFEVVNLERGQSILIHSGTEAIGQAAINIALHFECHVFITVASEKKKTYLKTLYPFLKETQISYLEDVSFQTSVLKQTRGKGVDVVINLSGRNLQLSTLCLAPNGKFVELGKDNLYHDSSVSSGILSRGCRFVGINLNSLMKENVNFQQKIQSLLMKGVAMNYVKPIQRLVYNQENIKGAFDYMLNGTPNKKIMIKFRDEKRPVQMKAKAKYYCSPKRVYIVVGGLGGFGMEFLDWLIDRNARKIVIAVRSDVFSGYQQFKLKRWREKGTYVKIVKTDLSRTDECSRFLRDASHLGEVDAIFNFAIVLHNALIENQTEENFKQVLLPKMAITENLDIFSRKLCPQLRKFVTFSSIVSGRGNAGQTNYGMGNSVMERMCEKRRSEGIPALAIQWGIIGDVGIVVEKLVTDKRYFGVLEQGLISCLNTMDEFLTQEQTIVSSSVLDDSNTNTSATTSDLMTQITDILGVTNSKNVSMHSTLADLGLDSTSSVELRRLLRVDYNIDVTTKDLRNMTLFIIYIKQKPIINIKEVQNILKCENKFISELLSVLPIPITKSKDEKEEEFFIDSDNDTREDIKRKSLN